MNSSQKKISSFTDLHAWQKGHESVLHIYRITVTFPKEEMYALTSQLRRAITSVTANIAEGFGRRTYKDKVHFYYQANGSLLETKNFIIVARDLGYIDIKQYEDILKLLEQTHKLLQGLIRKTNSNI